MRAITPYDRESLRSHYQAAQPFPHMVIDNFPQPELAEAAADCFFTFDEARRRGFEFKAVNENLKIQIVDPEKFPDPIRAVAEALSDRPFLDDLSYITGIQRLQWDPTYAGGGMHQTAKSGWLDVHVDFNFNETLQMHRRLNILVYLNKQWEDSWGGMLELWDKDVKNCLRKVAPAFNRCVVFSTSEISFHGVTAVHSPDGIQRCSFAAYYYTKEAPPGWNGSKHSTIFRARPEEYFKRNLLMPAEAAKRATGRGIVNVKQALKRLIGGK